MIGLIIQLAFIGALLAGLWKTFEKTGHPGWHGIVPFYNMYLMVQMVGKPILWFILMFVPIVNIVIMILVCIEFAKLFGKGSGFGVGLALLGFIFFPILGFGDAKFIGSTSPQGFQPIMPPAPNP